MPSIVAWVPFQSPATTMFQESQMSLRDKNIPSDMFKIRRAHIAIYQNLHSSLWSYTEQLSTMLKPPRSNFTHRQITQRLCTIQPCDYPRKKIFLYAPQHCSGRLPAHWGNSYFAVEGHLDSHERFSVSGVHCLSGLYIVNAFGGIRHLYMPVVGQTE